MDANTLEPPAGETPVALADLQPAPVQPRRRPWRWVAAFVVVAAVAVGAIMATGGSASKSPIAVLADASGNTTRSGTAHTSMVETIDADGQTVDLLDITGESDFGRKATSMSMSGRGRTVLSIIQVADITYMSSPFVALPDGAQWVSATPADLKITGGQSPLGSNDPTQGLKYLSAITGNPKEVGHASVDGVDTTHYTFTVDMKAYLASVAKAAKAMGVSSLGSSFDALAGVVDLSKLPSEAWIDSQGRVRRFMITINASEGGHTEKVVDTMSYSHFDEPVSVSAPAKSATLTFSQFPNFLTELSAAGQPTQSS